MQRSLGESLTSKLKNLGGEVLKDGRGVDGGSGTDTLGSGHALLEEPVDTADRELDESGESVQRRRDAGRRT